MLNMIMMMNTDCLMIMNRMGVINVYKTTNVSKIMIMHLYKIMIMTALIVTITLTITQPLKQQPLRQRQI